MKLISYNLNGIRSALGKDLTGWLKCENPDILCIQETKAQPDQMSSHLFEEMGYGCYWHSAVKRGYSGTGIVSKINFDKVEFGTGIEKFDVEGRLIRADFDDKTLVCSYFPSGSMGDVRQEFKMDYLYAFTKYIKNLQKERQNLIITGDFNICHKPVDINNPEKHIGVSGFLPEERQWFDEFMELGFVDTFREFCKDGERYSWWSYRSGARPRNLGWRIDYFLVSESLKNKLVDADILDSVVHSDHCPVKLVIS